MAAKFASSRSKIQAKSFNQKTLNSLSTFELFKTIFNLKFLSHDEKNLFPDHAVFGNGCYQQGLRSVSLGAELALPTGDFGDLSGLGFGASAGYDFPITEQFKVGGSAGYILLLVKDEYKDFLRAIAGGNDVDVNLAMIPIQGHAKYGVTEQFYIMGLLGVHMIRVKVKVLGESESDSESEFSFGFGAGLNLGAADIGVRYQIINDANYIGARIAYNFGG